LKIQNLRVAHKMWLVTLGSLLALLAGATAVFLQVQQATQRVVQTTAEYQKRIDVADDWRRVTETLGERMLANAANATPDMAAVFGQRVKDGFAQTNAVRQRVLDMATDNPQEQQALADVVAAREVMLGLTKKLETLRQSAGASGALYAFLGTDYVQGVDRYAQTVQGYATALVQERDKAIEQQTQAQTRAMAIGAGVAVVILLCGIGAVYALIQSITTPLTQAVDSAAAIGAGDLTQLPTTERQDEFGHLLKAMHQMGQRLQQLVGNVQEGVETVTAASGEINAGNQHFSARTEQAAANLQQTAASLAQLTSGVSQSTQVAQEARQTVQDVTQAARHGGTVMSQVIGSMEQISQASARIADINGVIDGIAFQTNILALNAAVEAARAGEQGRGFAVVAGEVRTLAQRSAQAAKEIRALIDASGLAVDSGSAQVTDAGTSMQAIVQGVERAQALVEDIATLMGAQGQEIVQINQAVRHLDDMTQQNAALVEESTAASAALRDQAQRLNEMVARFRVFA